MKRYGLNNNYKIAAYLNFQSDEWQQLRSSQAWHAENSRYAVLQSYTTLVSVFDKQTGILYENKFSPTTSRQQTWWKRAIDIEDCIKETKSLQDFRDLHNIARQ